MGVADQKRTVRQWVDAAINEGDLDRAATLLADALAEVDYVLRDFRTDEVRSIDPALLDLVHRLRSLAATIRVRLRATGSSSK